MRLIEADGDRDPDLLRAHHESDPNLETLVLGAADVAGCGRKKRDVITPMHWTKYLDFLTLHRGVVHVLVTAEVFEGELPLVEGRRHREHILSVRAHASEQRFRLNKEGKFLWMGTELSIIKYILLVLARILNIFATSPNSAMA